MHLLGFFGKVCVCTLVGGVGVAGGDWSTSGQKLEWWAPSSHRVVYGPRKAVTLLKQRVGTCVLKLKQFLSSVRTVEISGYVEGTRTRRDFLSEFLDQPS